MQSPQVCIARAKLSAFSRYPYLRDAGWRQWLRKKMNTALTTDLRFLIGNAKATKSFILTNFYSMPADQKQTKATEYYGQLLKVAAELDKLYHGHYKPVLEKDVNKTGIGEYLAVAPKSTVERIATKAVMTAYQDPRYAPVQSQYKQGMEQAYRWAFGGGRTRQRRQDAAMALQKQAVSQIDGTRSYGKGSSRVSVPNLPPIGPQGPKIQQQQRIPSTDRTRTPPPALTSPRWPSGPPVKGPGRRPRILGSQIDGVFDTVKEKASQMSAWIKKKLNIGDVGFFGPAAIVTAPIWLPVVLLAGGIGAVILGYYIYKRWKRPAPPPTPVGATGATA